MAKMNNIVKITGKTAQNRAVPYSDESGGVVATRLNIYTYAGVGDRGEVKI